MFSRDAGAGLRRLTFVLLVGGMFMVACGDPANRDAADPLPTSAPIDDLEDLSRALSRAGTPMLETAALAPVHLDQGGQMFQVDQSLIYVYEYETAQARSAISETISVDGLSRDGIPMVWPDQPHIWTAGRLIVVYPGSDGGTILLLSGLLGDPITRPTATADEPYPPAVIAAIIRLASEQAVSPAQIEVLSFSQVEWPDGCLGLPEADEECTEALVPGWRIELSLEGQVFVLRSDELGANLRLE